MATTFLYEILIRGNPDGTLRGAHQIVSTVYDDGSVVVGLPMAVDPTNAAVVGVLGSFAGVAAQITALQSQVAALQAAALASQPVTQTGSNLTFLQFQALFTGDEETMIMTAAQSTPALMLWLLKAAGAQFIDLSDPQTKAGLDALVAVGVLTADRETAILAGTPPS